MTKRNRRKRVSEEEFDVTVTDDTIGSKTPSRVTTVDARDAQTALDVASDGQAPDGDTEVTVKKKDPKAGGMSGSGTGGVYSMGESKLSMKKIAESLSYPYSVSLPVQFKKFLRETSINFEEIGNTVMIRLESRSRVKSLLQALNKSNDPRADVIYSGISRSAS